MPSISELQTVAANQIANNSMILCVDTQSDTTRTISCGTIRGYMMNEIWLTLMVDGGGSQDDFINSIDGGSS